MGKTRKEGGRRQVAGCVPVLMPNAKAYENGGILVRWTEPMILLVTSRQKENEWILPKGGWEFGEEAEEAAIRELWEEAGIRGHAITKIGEYVSEEGKTPTMMHCFEVHVDVVEKNWPEQHERERRWFTLEEALETCTRGWMNSCIRQVSFNKSKV